jgi:hypothetical protein
MDRFLSAAVLILTMTLGGCSDSPAGLDHGIPGDSGSADLKPGVDLPRQPDLSNSPPDAPTPSDLGPQTPDDGAADLSSTDMAIVSECPQGVICVDALPFSHESNTNTEGSAQWDSYPCKSTADESGPEVIYRVDLPEEGFLSAAVYDEAGVDVDVHILDALDPESCLARGHHHAYIDANPGSYYVVVDSFASEGEVFSGSYRVDIGFLPPSKGPCQMEEGVMERVGDGGDHLEMPATGPMVMEAHLVTQEEPPPYPTTSTEELSEHYELSQEQTGLIMHRSQSWAPLEGGNFYGAGINSPTLFPVIHEGWYVNMYWTSSSRPDRGTRMILRVPGSDRAVVVAAGYETGPGNLSNIGGTPEEPHFYLETGHKDTLTLGIAVDQDLPFGPRRCTP